MLADQVLPNSVCAVHGRCTSRPPRDVVPMFLCWPRGTTLAASSRVTRNKVLERPAQPGQPLRDTASEIPFARRDHESLALIERKLNPGGAARFNKKFLERGDGFAASPVTLKFTEQLHHANHFSTGLFDAP